MRKWIAHKYTAAADVRRGPVHYPPPTSFPEKSLNLKKSGPAKDFEVVRVFKTCPYFKNNI